MHTLQTVDAVVFWYVPASQSTQALAADASEKVPVGQAAQTSLINVVPTVKVLPSPSLPSPSMELAFVNSDAVIEPAVDWP